MPIGAARFALGGGLSKVELEFIVVSGGGPGGYGRPNNVQGGGAGAGGYISSVYGEASGGGTNAVSILEIPVNETFTITVGGAESDSDILTAYGNVETDHGGTGLGRELGANGGSGGAAWGLYASQLVGLGIAGQGRNGGTYYVDYNYGPNQSGGGGGGATNVGVSATVDTTNRPNGGNGVTTNITGTAVALAGGGGGGNKNGYHGLGGSGGGGAGGTNAGVNGTANTGGGGGGGTNWGAPGGSGGSGVIYLRYPSRYTLNETGLTVTTNTVGANKVSKITAGTDAGVFFS